MSETKVCNICKEEKPILSFLKIKGKRAGASLAELNTIKQGKITEITGIRKIENA